MLLLWGNGVGLEVGFVESLCSFLLLDLNSSKSQMIDGFGWLMLS